MDDMELRFKEIKRKFAKHKAEYLKESNPITKTTIILTKREYKKANIGNDKAKSYLKYLEGVLGIKYRQKAYMCDKCKIFHKYKYKGKPSKTHKSHFKHFVKYKENYTQSELWKLGFKKEWNRESNRSELQKRKGTKQ